MWPFSKWRKYSTSFSPFGSSIFGANDEFTKFQQKFERKKCNFGQLQIIQNKDNSNHSLLADVLAKTSVLLLAVAGLIPLRYRIIIQSKDCSDYNSYLVVCLCLSKVIRQLLFLTIVGLIPLKFFMVIQTMYSSTYSPYLIVGWLGYQAVTTSYNNWHESLRCPLGIQNRDCLSYCPHLVFLWFPSKVFWQLPFTETGLIALGCTMAIQMIQTMASNW